MVEVVVIRLLACGEHPTYQKRRKNEKEKNNNPGQTFLHLSIVTLPDTCGKAECTIWNDVGTYLTSSIDPVEKASLIVAFAHFKKEGKQ